MRKLKGTLWLALASLGLNILSLAIPIYFMQVYDRILPSGASGTLIWITLAVIIALILESLLSYIRRELSSANSSQYSIQAERKLMEHLSKLSPSQFKKTGFSLFDRKFRYIQEIASFYRGNLFQSILDLPFIALFLAGIYIYGGRLIWVPLGLIMLLIPFYLFMGILLRKGSLKLSQANMFRFKYLADILMKIHFLKSQAYEESLLRRGESLQDQYSVVDIEQKNLALIPQLAGGSFALLMVYGTILYGGIMVVQGDLTIGLVTACTMLSRRTIAPFQNLSRFMMSLSRIRSQLKELKDIKGTNAPSRPSPLHNIRLSGHMEWRNLSLQGDNGTALKNLSFTVDRGHIMAVSGKQSMEMELFRDLLVGFRKPDNGTMIVDNMRISEDSNHYLSPQFVLIPRQGRLYSGTLLENIAGFDSSMHLQALDAAALLGLDPLVANLPLGYETQVRRQSSAMLSPAIIQRISIARALVSRPRIIISDFCDDWMDQETLSLFHELLEHNRSSCTVLLLTRRSETKALSDSLFELDSFGFREVTHG